VDTANIIASISAAVAILGLSLAVLQFLDSRRRTRTERERLAQHQERLRTAVTAANVAGQTADYIVQRGKEEGVSVQELQSVARVLRGSLMLLARQLDDESNQVPTLSTQRPFLSFREGHVDGASPSDSRGPVRESS
jgi:uncharacterized protein HemX